jgi:hypothetical protein
MGVAWWVVGVLVSGGTSSLSGGLGCRGLALGDSEVTTLPLGNKALG